MLLPSPPPPPPPPLFPSLSYRMDMMRDLMASVTDLVWEASNCQVGGSLGFTARLLADSSRLLEDLITLRPAWCVWWGKEEEREKEGRGRVVSGLLKPWSG